MSIPRFGVGKTGTGPGNAVADYTLNRLKEWGIRRIFGYPEMAPTDSSAPWSPGTQ